MVRVNYGRLLRLTADILGAILVMRNATTIFMSLTWRRCSLTVAPLKHVCVCVVTRIQCTRREKVMLCTLLTFVKCKLKLRLAIIKCTL